MKDIKKITVTISSYDAIENDIHDILKNGNNGSSFNASKVTTTIHMHSLKDALLLTSSVATINHVKNVTLRISDYN